MAVPPAGRGWRSGQSGLVDMRRGTKIGPDAVASNGDRLSDELRLTADRSATIRCVGGASCIRQSTFEAIAGSTRSGCEVSAASTFWSGRTTVGRPRFWNASSCFVRRAIRALCLPSSGGAVSGATRMTGIPSRSSTSIVCFRGMTCREKSSSKGVVTVPEIRSIGTGRSRCTSKIPVNRNPENRIHLARMDTSPSPSNGRTAETTPIRGLSKQASRLPDTSPRVRPGDSRVCETVRPTGPCNSSEPAA